MTEPASCHDDATGPPPPATDTVVIALVGRPNSGKSSLYNRVTGGHARVGNFPGITVDVLEAAVDVASFGRVAFVDLPGVYSLENARDPATDEGITRAFLDRVAAEKRDVLIVQVVDATQLALGLRLTEEILRRPERALIAVTQCDLLAARGQELDAPALEGRLGVPVVAVSARDPGSRDVILAAVANELRRTDAKRRPSPERLDTESIATDVLRDCDTVDARARAARKRTARVDRWLLHPVLGIVVFAAIMTAVFAAVFVISDPVTNLLDSIVRRTTWFLAARWGHGLWVSFLGAGILGGAGTVLAFLPQIVILTVAMELLEASGYLSRGAFIVDRLLRVVGLGGRAFMPMLTAHACAVPAIAATRIMREPRERLATILVLPLMTCSARIPVYSLLISAFFSRHSVWTRGLIFVSLYALGVALGLIAAMVIRRTVARGRRLPLLLEMPAYRLPEAALVWLSTRRAAWRFVRDVGTNILLASAVLWVLLTVPFPGQSASTAPTGTSRTPALERSIAARIARSAEPVTRAAGFDWRINVGLIASFGARELMVGTMGIIFGIEHANDNAAPLAQRLRTARGVDGRPIYSTRTALALMAFFLLACQCMSTVAAIQRETKSWRWPAFVLVYTYALAYLAAVATYQLSGRLGAA